MRQKLMMRRVEMIVEVFGLIKMRMFLSPISAS